MKLLDIDCVSMYLNNDLMVEETSDCCKVIADMGVAPVSVKFRCYSELCKPLCNVPHLVEIISWINYRGSMIRGPLHQNSST